MDTAVSARIRDVLDELVQALEAKPEEQRSFCIPPLNGLRLTVIHRGLAGGHMEISRGLLDELVQAGFLRKVDPSDRRDCLYEVTERAFAYQASRSTTARATSGGRLALKVIAAALVALAALSVILTWAGIHP
jgi:hypothetical protein